MFRKLISFISELSINDDEEHFSIPKDGKYTYLGQGYNPKSRRSLVVKDNQIIIEENNINSDRNE